jgi:hypothetical protein
MTMTLYHTLYRKLTVLIPTLPQVPEYVKSQVPGFMDLNLDALFGAPADSAYQDQSTRRLIPFPFFSCT